MGAMVEEGAYGNISIVIYQLTILVEIEVGLTSEYLLAIPSMFFPSINPIAPQNNAVYAWYLSATMSNTD
jgi:hypothetical protein